ncbi:MAG: SGNH/GDSL hydrolase family protein [Candidatus Krumholzibacteriia bacterium]
MRSQRLRLLFVNGALVVLSFAVAVLLGELLVRRVAPQNRPLSVALRHLHVPDAELGYLMAPHFRRRVRTPVFEGDVRTNSLGLRDHEIGPPRPGTLRILGLGDSFAFGVHAGPLENCYLKRLEAHLARRLLEGPTRASRWDGVEIVNAGVVGYGTPQEVGLLQRLGDSLQPDAVLLSFYLGNDFTDNSGRTRMTVVDGYQMLEASAAPYRAHSRPLHRRARLHLHAHSQLYLLLKQRLLHPTRSWLAGSANLASAATDRKPLDYYRFDAGFANSMRVELTPDMTTAMQETRRALDELRHWCETHGAAALLVAIPAEQQVDVAAKERWLRSFGLEAEELDFGLPNRRLARLAEEVGLPLYDLTQEFAARIAAGAELHLTGDNHWNSAGHAAAAELLVEPVLQRLVTPTPLLGSR